MKKRIRLTATVLLLCLMGTMSAFGEETEYAKRLEGLQTPAEIAMATGTLQLHPGDTVCLATLSSGIIPYDEKDAAAQAAGGTVTVSDEAVLAAAEGGCITALQEGSCDAVYASAQGETTYRVTVSEDTVPFSVQNYLYVLNREYYATARARLQRYNTYAKWYYGKKKEVGWCSVFTIYCANASGNAVWRYKESNATERFPALNYDNPPQVVYMAEGEVGHQYDAFLKMGRFGAVPKPGYLVIYADLSKAYRTTHIASVVEVEDLGNGRYVVTTVEGNMSNTVKRYTYLYDANADNHLVGADKKAKREKLKENMAELPLAEQTDPLVQYELHTDHWAVFGFCETW